MPTTQQTALTEAGFTQKDVARRLSKSPVEISRWFTGKRTPSRYNRQRLARVLGRDFVKEHFPDA